MRDGRTVMTSRMADIDKLALVAAMLGRDLETGARARDRLSGDARRAPAARCSRRKGSASGSKVRDARVEVRAGQIVGLAGLLGSGRTETARAIFGADPPDAGAIRLMGKAASPREPVEAIALGVGYCTEDRKVDGIVPDMSVRENITLALLPRLIPPRRRRRGAAARDRRPVHRAPGDQDRQHRAEDPRAVGRQPAEGAAGALALHRPQAARSSTSRPAASTSAPRPRFKSLIQRARRPGSRRADDFLGARGDRRRRRSGLRA